MKPVKFIVIGGSAGSLQVILDLLGPLDAGFPIPILMVLHRTGLFDSGMEELLLARTRLRCKEVEEKEMLSPGTVYVCPADYHVLIEKDHSLSLDYSERVNYSRPSIDVSFRSAADIYGEELICLLLSGGNADGALGLEYARERGATTIVQDPSTAEVSYMPYFAIHHTEVDLILRPEEMGAAIFSRLPGSHSPGSGSPGPGSPDASLS
jgi:two-component system, chemotaxis family, protein-glutamate methylesterase/glutaminase